MKIDITLRFTSFFCAMLISSALSGGISCAHVGADDMPDSVAEVEYQIYLEFKPNDLVVLNKLGMVYFRLNKLPAALKEFSKVLKRDPDNYDALDGMGLVMAAQNNYEEAARYHRQAIILNPKDMMTYYHLGSALEKKGELAEAAKAYQTALEKFNEQYSSTSNNKNAAEFAGKVKEALSQIENKL